MDGMSSGQGTHTCPDAYKCEDEWKEDQRNGMGILTSNYVVRYVGKWQDNKFIDPSSELIAGMK